MMHLFARRTTVTVLLVALGILLAACGQGQQSSTSTNTPVSSTVATVAAGENASETPDTPTAVSEGNPPQGGLDLLSVDPCKLLTQDDVISAMGNVPFAPKPMTQNEYRTACSYVEPTLEANSPRLFLSLDPVDTWDMHSTDVQPVDGIGDGAYTQNFDGWRSVWVLLKNKVIVEMDIYPPDTEMAKQLISKVIERLP
jgi:hypothetical protein